MSTRDLIDAIHAGEASQIQSAFENAMASRIADRLDTMRQEVAKNMFKAEQAVVEEAAEVVEEELEEIDEAEEKDIHPDHIHVSKAPGNKYKVHAVGKNFSSGIKVGEHLSDTELDDAGEMGAHIKMKKPAK